MYSFVKRSIALCLVVLLCITSIPASAFAADSVGNNSVAAVFDNTRAEANPAEAEPAAEDEPDESPQGSSGNDVSNENDSSNEEAPESGISPLVEGAATENTLAISGSIPAATLANGTYYIRPASSRTRVLDVASGSLVNWANIQLYSSNKTPAQQFTVTYDTETGYYALINVKSGLAIDVAAAAKVSGTNIHQYEANGTDAQKWLLVPDAARPGAYTIVSALSPTGSNAKQLVADVASASDTNGANIQLWTANGTVAQSFYFLSTEYTHPSVKTIEDGIYTINSAINSSFVIDVPAASNESWTQLQLYKSNNTIAQAFYFRWDGEYYSITNLSSGLAFDVRSAGIVSGTVLQQYTSNGTIAQKWAVEKHADGAVTIYAANSGLAIDVQAASAANSTKMQLYESNGTNAQKFILKEYEQQNAVSRLLNYDLVSLIPTALTTHRVDVASASLTSGANIQAYSSNNTPAQMFVPKLISESSGNPYESIYSFSAAQSLMYLTDTGTTAVQASGTNNAPNENQKWKVRITSGGYTLQNCATGRYLALSGTDIVTEDLQVVYPFAASASADTGSVNSRLVFKINKALIVFSGYQKILTTTGMSLDVYANRCANWTNIQLYSSNNTEAQIWTLEANSTEYVTIRNVGWRRSLDVASAVFAEGTNVHQYVYNGTVAQQWKLVPAGKNRYYIATAAAVDRFYLAATSNASGGNVYITSDLSKALTFSFTSTNYPRGAAVDRIMNPASGQVGNQGGYPYWSWYGYNYRVDWCACFVSWCANQGGYIGAGIIPKYALCQSGVNWFKARLRWQSVFYIPQRGDIVFYDYEGDGWSDHTGIVDYCDGTYLYTIEGNVNDVCRRVTRSLDSGIIMGYGLPAYT